MGLYKGGSEEAEAPGRSLYVRHEYAGYDDEQLRIAMRANPNADLVAAAAGEFTHELLVVFGRSALRGADGKTVELAQERGIGCHAIAEGETEWYPGIVVKAVYPPALIRMALPALDFSGIELDKENIRSELSIGLKGIFLDRLWDNSDVARRHGSAETLSEKICVELDKEVDRLPTRIGNVETIARYFVALGNAAVAGVAAEFGHRIVLPNFEFEGITIGNSGHGLYVASPLPQGVAEAVWRS